MCQKRGASSQSCCVLGARCTWILTSRQQLHRPIVRWSSSKSCRKLDASQTIDLGFGRVLTTDKRAKDPKKHDAVEKLICTYL